MVNLPFYRVSEKRPAHHQDIVTFRDRGWFEYASWEMIEARVEYQWTELDENGEHTGIACCYNEGDVTPENCRLDVIIDGLIATGDELWMDLDEFFELLDKK